MKVKHKNSESGQAIVLLVLSFIVLLGFSALAIDGSMIYSDRRTAQNAADAAAMAGAGKTGELIRAAGASATKDNWTCNDFHPAYARGAQIMDAAIANASTNNYVISAGSDLKANCESYVPTDTNNVDLCCNQNPPFIDVIATIEQETPTTFAHFVYGGQLMNRVEAISRVYPPPPVGEGNCMISLTSLCTGLNKGTRIQAGSKTHLINCGSWSNSCTLFNACTGEFVADEITFFTSDWDTIDECKDLWDVDQITPTTDPIEIDIPQPNCGTEPGTLTAYSGPGTIDPGWYRSISVTGNNDVLNMNPGLYCIKSNQGFNFSGKTLIGNGVTIAMLGTGDFTTAATAEVHLSAPPVGCEVGAPAFSGCPPSVGGLLIWVPANGANIKLTGKATSSYEGTVFIRNGGGAIEVAGTDAVDSPYFGVSLIGDTVKVTGDSAVYITYNPGGIYHGPALLEVAQ